jgi:hypothetical protein
MMKYELTPERVMEIGKGFEDAFLACLPVDKRLKGLKPEERIAGLKPEDILASLSDEDIMAYINKRVKGVRGEKQKLIGEINALPEELMHRFYRIVRNLRSELKNKTAVMPQRGSLRGIWGNWEIDESHIFAAKKSLFSYESKDEGL